jgi:predicted nuclease of predicted toxin-antitoxin system
MRWLADECVDAPLIAKLREAGHDVVYIADTTPGVTDIQIVSIAIRERRLLLTDDKDFGEMVVRWRRPLPGLVLLRLDAIESGRRWTRLSAAIERYSDNLFGRFTIVEDSRLRSRAMTID